MKKKVENNMFILKNYISNEKYFIFWWYLFNIFINFKFAHHVYIIFFKYVLWKLIYYLYQLESVSFEFLALVIGIVYHLYYILYNFYMNWYHTQSLKHIFFNCTKYMLLKFLDFWKLGCSSTVVILLVIHSFLFFYLNIKY